jgi:Kef-type K+ transport system membrane component KefB
VLSALFPKAIKMIGKTVSSPSFLDGRNPLSQEICLFLAQLVLIIVISKTIAIGLKRFQQPAVISEVLGGLLLGPTALGRIPGFTSNLFPDESLPMLKLMADFGLLLFLFLIGMELDPTKIGPSIRKCSGISLAGILLPFSISIPVSKLIYDKYTDPSVSFLTFSLFCGVAMAITAFPVLARIMTEQNLLHTEVGQTALAAGIIEDGIAWCLLILVIALVNNPANAINALYAFLIVAAFAVSLWLAVRPLLMRLIDSSESGNGASQFNVFVVFVIMAISAFFTQAVGVDVIFGAFLVGLIVPHTNGFAIAMTEKLEDLVTILFLPLYFAYAGLGVNLSALNDLETWGFVVLVLVVAVFGKIIGCYAAARLSGTPHREALTIGLLMNTKG